MAVNTSIPNGLRDSTLPATRRGAASQAGAQLRSNPWYAPKLWSGMTLGAWLRLMRLYPGRISPRYFGHAAFYTLSSLFNSTMGLAQEAVFGRRIRRTEVRAPLFVLGHWRSGTTLLHELLVRDPTTAFPTTYHCASPSHFLLSERIVVPVLERIVPKKRPQDDMELGLTGPQEEDFALTNLGLGNPYTQLAFPHEPVVDDAYYELDALTPAERGRWLTRMRRFFQAVQMRSPEKRIVAKSPLQSFRIPWLLESFPDARFIHIVRNPHDVLASTEHFRRIVALTQGLQKPRLDELAGDVVATYLRLMRRLDATRGLVPAGRYVELRYEDLVADPLATLEQTYRRLELPDFAAARPGMERYLAEHSDYRRNRFLPDSAFHQRIARECREYLSRWNYASPKSAAPPLPSAGCAPTDPPVKMPVPIESSFTIG